MCGREIGVGGRIGVVARFLVALSALLIASAFVGCSDDSTSPSNRIYFDDLAGEWEAIYLYAGDLEYELPHNNVIWYFADDGKFCSLWRTAYGAFYTDSTGSFNLRHSALTEVSTQGVEERWVLSLTQNADTLRVVAAVLGSTDLDGWLLVPADDVPESTCFGDGAP